ncbi:MAG: hypothetical protein KDJ86_15260 [Bauldia sp.]|uniref:hypothetical protein n=1 Tax=Bauldia sp. TaxID=2575872 RepID=UPI001D3545C6|nr:hypothetical protein [Bauldia sp.]MCB1490086.1 hypothetical protein [Bauldia sp.]MCB1497146.1 hypothetical protein [Bauldia sp.]
MRAFVRVVSMLGGAACLAAGPAFADEAANEAAVAHLEAGTLAAGEAELASVLEADPANDDARMGLGTIRFVKAIETLSQGLYRYGLQPPQSMMMPIVRLPVPVNPNPEPIAYADFRGLLDSFVSDIAAAEATLDGVGDSGVKLRLDLTKLRYDANGDGTVTDDERFVSVIQRVTGFREEDMPPTLVFAFDKGDALWLRGYCNVIMAFGDFWLAHDWHESFDVAFPHFFPKVESDFAKALAGPGGDPMYQEAAPFADFISFFHIRWPVTEPERMAAARQHIKAMIALSRESWTAIEAETDDDREWLPNPNQTSPFASVQVDAGRIAAWRAVLDQAELVIDGKKLVPHWRFDKGFNLARVFEEPQAFDLVLWLTGPAALPYLEDGPVTTTQDWEAMVGAFEGSFGVSAIWYN